MVRVALMCLVLLGLQGSAWADQADQGSQRPHEIGRPVDAWYELKAQLAEEYDLELNIAYSALYLQANKSAPDPLRSAELGYPVFGRKQALSGDVEIDGSFGLWGRETPSPGRIIFKGESRHGLGLPVLPARLNREIGSRWSVGTGYGEFDLSIVEFWLKQNLAGDAVEIHVGKMFPLTQYDYFPLDNFRTDFLDGAFSFHPALALPDYGLGANVTVRPRRDVYLRAGIDDANGQPERSGFETVFDEREYFTVVEAGWDPGFLDRKPGSSYADYHVTVWHADKRVERGVPEGWGVTVSAFQQTGRWHPFLRYSYSEGDRGGPTLVEHLVTTGFAVDDILGRKADRVGIGLAWGRPSDALLRDQFSSEFYYRIQLTREFALTQSLQVIANPAENPATDTILVGGLRGRVQF